MNVPILYEDNHLLVAVKPPNVLSQADETGDDDMLSFLKAYIKEKYRKPGAVYLGLVHRLDRPVGGVMVFARTSKAAERLSKQFSSRAAKKEYIAVVDGEPPYTGRLENTLDFIEGRAVESESGKKSALTYRVLGRENGRSLVRIALETGRKHQIRAQFACAGWPIVCDQRYHPRPEKGQIRLWAYRLTFTHPTTKETLTFFSPPPWREFPAQLAVLNAPCAGVYMDETLVCVDKDAGVEVSRADAGEQSLQAALEEALGPLWPVHRLDANTEGLLLFARSESAMRALMDAQHGFLKTYRCVTVGAPPVMRGEHRAYLIKDAQSALVRVSAKPAAGAKEIVTRWRVLSKKGELCLVEVTLVTGRTHQIRAHLSYLGCPVLGDDKYGDREINRRFRARRQQLLSCRLTLHFDENSPLRACDGRTFTSLRTLEFFGEERT